MPRKHTQRHNSVVLSKYAWEILECCCASCTLQVGIANHEHILMSFNHQHFLESIKTSKQWNIYHFSATQNVLLFEAHKYRQYSPSVSMKGSMFLKLRPKKNQAPTTVKLSYRHRSTYAVQDSMWSVLVLQTHHIWAFVGTRPWTFTCSSTVQNCSKNRGRCNLLELPNLLKQRGSQYLCFPFWKLDAKGIGDWRLGIGIVIRF